MFLAQFPKETEFTQTYHVCISPTVIILNVLANFKQIWQSEKDCKDIELP